MTIRLLTPPDVRALVAELQIRPTKTLGQNFVHDTGTVRAIAASAGIEPGAQVVEVGPGLGSLTLALLETGALVSAIEIDPVLARALPVTIGRFAPELVPNFALTCRDALTVTSPADLAVPGNIVFKPSALIANLPYNVAVPILLTLLANVPSFRTVVVMVQAEVADRIAAAPGSRTYGVPSVKVQWYGRARRTRTVGRKVFWPVPNVDSAIVRIDCDSSARSHSSGIDRAEVFAVIDAAFGQRRKTLRAALASWAGGPARAELILQLAKIDPRVRGEALRIEDFTAIAFARREVRAKETQSNGNM